MADGPKHSSTISGLRCGASTAAQRRGDAETALLGGLPDGDAPDVGMFIKCPGDGGVAVENAPFSSGATARVEISSTNLVTRVSGGRVVAMLGD